MSEENLTLIEEKIQKSLTNLKNEFLKLIFNKPNAGLIENIKIQYYEEKCILKQLSTISIENNNTISIKPFDKKITMEIYKEIKNLNLDLNPITTNEEIKIIFQPMSTEKRIIFIKKSKKISEETKISIRNIRREFIQKIKNDLKEKKISEDQEKKILNKIEQIVEKNIKIVEELTEKKEKDLLKI